MSRRSLVIALLALAAFGAGFLVSRLSAPGLPETATVLSKPRALPAFEFVDQHGAAFTKSEFEDRWSLVFFGFTRCPDVCPMTLTTLKSVSAQLDDLPADTRPQLVFVSLDPMHDTPEIIGRYVRHFGADVVGATAELGVMTPLLDTLSVARAYPRIGDTDDYTVDHSAGIYVISPAAEQYAVFTPPHFPGDIARDYRRMVNAWPAT